MFAIVFASLAYQHVIRDYPMEFYKVADWLFRRTIGRLPCYANYSDDIEILKSSDAAVADILRQEAAAHAATGSHPSFLDVGARDGIRSTLAAGYSYTGMDIIPRGEDIIAGDICACPQIADNTYDVVFSYDVLEHVQRPWDAAAECIRIAKSGGLLVHRTLFAYRYHAQPVDYWRFTSQGLEHLFCHTGHVDTVLKGYDIRNRRRDHRGSSKRLNGPSKPPVDWLGGFRENWQVLFVGRKK